MPTIAPEKMSASQAMNTYIKELCTPSPYTYNMTIYKLQSSKSKHTNDTRLGICHQGLEVYEVHKDLVVKLTPFMLWLADQLVCVISFFPGQWRRLSELFDWLSLEGYQVH